MEKILITGANGFLGSYLVHHFIKNDYIVHIVIRSTSNTWRLDNTISKCQVYYVDEQSLKEIISDSKPDILIHTICNYGRKGSSLKDLITTNLTLGVEILEQAILNDVKLFINADTLLPRYINDYSLSKGQFASWLKTRSALINIVNFRIEHMYGPLDDSNKFINWLITQMLDTTVDSIDLTSGVQKRDFIYIADVVDAFELVIRKNSELKGWNELDLATQTFTRVKDFILEISRELERAKNIEIRSKLNFGAIPYREGELMEPLLNNANLQKLGWVPEYNIQKGIQLTLEDNK